MTRNDRPDVSGAQSPSRPRAADRRIVAVLAAAGLIGAFMQTLVTPVIPALPGLLDTTPADATWVLTATLLGAAVATPITGRLGDMIGKRRMHLMLLTVLAAGSVISACSFSLAPMVVGRALQGIGLGVLPLGISILRDSVEPQRLSRDVAVMSATLGVGGSVGLPIAAVVAHYFDWHALFWLAAVLTIGSIVAVAVVVPPSPAPSGGTFDPIGACGLAGGLVAILLATSKGAAWGWFSWPTLALFAAGVATLAGWAAHELRCQDPIVDLRATIRRPVLLTNLAAAALGFAYFVVVQALPVVLQAPRTAEIGLGQTVIVTGLCLMPLGLVMFAVSPLAARITDRYGPRTSMLAGGGTVAAGLALGTVSLHTIWQILLVVAVVGAGMGLAYAAMTILIMQSVPLSQTAAANGVNTLMRLLGSTTSATITGVILATHLGSTGSPTLGAAQAVFVVGGALALLSILFAALLPPFAVKRSIRSHQLGEL